MYSTHFMEYFDTLQNNVNLILIYTLFWRKYNMDIYSLLRPYQSVCTETQIFGKLNHIFCQYL